MNGQEFIEFLQGVYTHRGQNIYGNHVFSQWFLSRRYIRPAFQFTVIHNGNKSIPYDILSRAWEANIEIDDDWLRQIFNVSFHGDCRLHMLNFLIREYAYLRTS